MHKIIVCYPHNFYISQNRDNYIHFIILWALHCSKDMAKACTANGIGYNLYQLLFLWRAKYKSLNFVWLESTKIYLLHMRMPQLCKMSYLAGNYRSKLLYRVAIFRLHLWVTLLCLPDHLILLFNHSYQNCHIVTNVQGSKLRGAEGQNAS